MPKLAEAQSLCEAIQALFEVLPPARDRARRASVRSFS